MTIKIPPDLEQIIHRQLSSGRFRRAEDVLRAALENLETSEVRANRDMSEILKEQVSRGMKAIQDAVQLSESRGGIPLSKSSAERLPEFLTSSDDSFVPADIPMPKGRFIQPVKGGKRLPEFHGLE